MHRSRRYLLLGLVLLAAALRFHGLFANTFHADEALFAAWARRIAVWRDPLLIAETVDKPPLLFYLQALFYPVLGTPAPWVARLPNLIAGLLLVPLTARLVWHFYRDWLAAFAAALFVTLSPYTVQFSPSAFTDPLLVTFLVACLVAAARLGPPTDSSGHVHFSHQASLSALFFGLALVTKHQAWLFLPLWLSLALLTGWSRREWGRGLLIIVAFVGGLLLWEWARTGSLELWALQVDHIGGLRLIWSWELWSRLEAWGYLWGVMLGSPVLAFALVLTLPIFLALLIYEQNWPTAFDQLFLLFVLGYVALHWFVAVPVWDRYLLPLVPLGALLFGRFLSRVLAFVREMVPQPGRRWLDALVVFALLLLLLPAGWQARRGQFPVGALPGADSGASMMTSTLTKLPAGTVLYDHWYGWQWKYYLFDSGIFSSHFPRPGVLIKDLDSFYDPATDRYLILPLDRDETRPMTDALAEAGYSLEPIEEAGAMVLYRINR